MELTKKERLSFIYQLRILEALYPKEAAHYATHRKALEEGYALHYGWLTEHLYDELSEADCKEVLNILDMYRAITFGLNKIDQDDALRNHHYAKFPGFDGNNEGHQMAYAHYFIIDLGRFDELRQRDFYSNYNSHMRMLPKYRKMLKIWSAKENKFELIRNDIEEILEAE